MYCHNTIWARGWYQKYHPAAQGLRAKPAGIGMVFLIPPKRPYGNSNILWCTIYIWYQVASKLGIIRHWNLKLSLVSRKFIFFFFKLQKFRQIGEKAVKMINFTQNFRINVVMGLLGGIEIWILKFGIDFLPRENFNT